MAGRYASGHRWRQSRSWLLSEQRPCWICEAFGRPAEIDYSLPGQHPMSFEADHLVPTSKGGDPYARENLAATHRACNEWRGNRSVAEVLALARRARCVPKVVATTEW